MTAKKIKRQRMEEKHAHFLEELHRSNQQALQQERERRAELKARAAAEAKRREKESTTKVSDAVGASGALDKPSRYRKPPGGYKGPRSASVASRKGVTN